jgi:cell division protein ZapA
MRAVKVKILDNEYLVRSEEDEGQVQRIAEYVSQKLSEVRDNTDGLSEKKAAILAALNIASDFLHLRKEHDELLANLRQRARTLIGNIDSVIGEDVPPAVF